MGNCFGVLQPVQYPVVIERSIVGCEHEPVTIGLGCSVRRCNGIAADAEKQSKQQCNHGRALKEFIWQCIHRLLLTAAG